MTTAVPIFVMGAPHSGTTILYRMLAMHPDVTWFSQLSCRAGSIPGRRRIPMVSLIEPVLRRRPHWWMKAQTRWSEYYLPLPSGAMGIFEYLLPERATISNDESAARMRRIFDAECRRWRKGTIVLKHPRLCQKVPEIRYAYPTAPFIHIIRDGRAVALSIRWKFMRRGESSIQGLAGRPGRGSTLWPPWSPKPRRGGRSTFAMKTSAWTSAVRSVGRSSSQGSTLSDSPMLGSPPRSSRPTIAG